MSFLAFLYVRIILNNIGIIQNILFSNVFAFKYMVNTILSPLTIQILMATFRYHIYFFKITNFQTWNSDEQAHEAVILIRAELNESGLHRGTPSSRMRA